jgi:hypothetical protein
LDDDGAEGLKVPAAYTPDVASSGAKASEETMPTSSLSAVL